MIYLFLIYFILFLSLEKAPYNYYRNVEARSKSGRSISFNDFQLLRRHETYHYWSRELDLCKRPGNSRIIKGISSKISIMTNKTRKCQSKMNYRGVLCYEYRSTDLTVEKNNRISVLHRVNKFTSFFVRAFILTTDEATLKQSHFYRRWICVNLVHEQLTIYCNSMF